MGYGSRPAGPSFPRVLATLGVFAAIAVAFVIGRSEPPTAGAGAGGDRPEVDLRAQHLAAGTGAVEATIRRDPHGIPHILANDYKGLGFGYGYAFAQDNICTMADTYVSVRAERTRYFGAAGSYLQAGNGVVANNLNSDVFYQRIIDKGIIEDLLDDPAPTGPAPEIMDGVRGYVAGYNKYLADTGVNNLPDPRCRGAEWVKPIEEIDAYRRFYQLALLASQSVAINGIGSEKFPGADAGVFDPNDLINALGENFPPDIGSNAYGLGSEATDNGRGIVLGNPHFPWDGPERFYQTHLTIPGEINVSGGSLYGVPLVLIGHTDNLAWSHTVSTAFRFTPFQETLVTPTTYLYDGVPTPMTEDEVTVEGDPSTNGDDVTRTVYSTHHGPVFTDLLGVPLPWTPTTAFSMGDVNAGNFRYLNHFFEVNRAQSVDRLDEIEKTYQGIPWVNTIAADSSGEAYYADIGAIPNVSNAKATTCNSAVGVATYAALGLPVLKGDLSSCEWDDDPDAVAPGIFGYGNLPHLFRNDYVTNSNDSYWLSNPEDPLEGYARIIGDEQTERALRTRIGLKALIEHFGNGPTQPADDPLNRQDVQDIVFNNRQYAAELWRDQLVTYCVSNPIMAGTAGPVNVSAACPILAAWDRHDNLDSNGAVLFREFAALALAGVSVVSDPSVYSTPFDAGDPVTDPYAPVDTPSGLNTANPKIQRSLADAVTNLTTAGIPLNAKLRDYQYEKRGADKIPIHGGPGGLGVFNAINVNGQVRQTGEVGYPNVPHGSSFVMVTQFKDPSGNPCGADDRSILTYSQSANEDSPYFKDQTQMFSDKQWVNPPFCESEVQAELGNPGWQSQTLTGCLPAGCAPAAAPSACSNLIRGSAKRDRLRGTSGSDRIRARQGDDRIRGGGGEDCLHGGSGDDVISSKDGARDLVRCGRGEDTVTKSDRADVLRGCEQS
jgi:acyl-homoserine-lactone acylase